MLGVGDKPMKSSSESSFDGPTSVSMNNCAFISMNDDFGYPTLSIYKEARVLITFTAGSDSIPKPLHQAMLLLISHYYDTREPVAYNANPLKVPRSVDFLCNQHKIRRG